MSEIFISSTLLWGSPLPVLLRTIREAGLAGPMNLESSFSTLQPSHGESVPATKKRFYNKCWGLVDTPVHKTPCLTIK